MISPEVPRLDTAEAAPAFDGQRRRILLVASTLHTGGAERVIACLARNISRAKFDVSVCYLKENGVVGAEIEREGTEVVPAPGLVPGAVDRWTWLKLRKLVKARRIELIHTHDVHGFMDGVACRLLGSGIKHVHTFHWGNYPQRESPYKQIENVMWRVPDALIAVGHRQADELRKLYSIPPHRLQVVWNGVDPQSDALAPEVLAHTKNSPVPIIGSISTLIEQKGVTHLLRAARLLRDRGCAFKLLIVGQGHLRAELEQQCASLQLNDCVHFLGWVTEAHKRALPACDIFVQSSLWEAMSVVVLEAMAHAKAMALTRVGDNEHMIEDGVSGLLVPKADPEALALALQRLLQSPDLRQQMGAAARARHQQFFTTHHTIAAHESLYEQLLG